MAILDLNTDVLPFLQKTADDTYGNIARTQTAAEQFVKSYLQRSIEEATYTEKLRSSDGQILTLKQRPVTSINWFRVGEATAVDVTNTNPHTTAQIAVTDTGLSLVYNGVATSGDFTFATNATIGDLATAVNAAGDGWSATVRSSFSGYQSSFLLPWPGRSAINNQTIALYIPDTDIEFYDLDDASGAIRLLGNFYSSRAWLADVQPEREHGSFHEAMYDTYINYTAGYTAANMPADLEYAILELIQYLYNKVVDGSFGVKACSIAGMSKELQGDGFGKVSLPTEVMETLNRYRDYVI